MIISPPVHPSELPHGTQLLAGSGGVTIIGDFDFETYSPAGFIWDSVSNRWYAPPGAKSKGLPAVGAAVYSEHPDAEVLSLSYNLKNGTGPKLWVPGQELPWDLFEYLKSGGLIEGWNVSFERWVWDNICVQKYFFPPLPFSQLRCAMAKSRAYGLPGRLEDAAKVLNVAAQKDKNGKRLLDKFSIPRDPTKANPALRTLCSEDPIDANALYSYNLQDIKAEAEVSALTPDLTPGELEFWQMDQIINRRGIKIDSEAVTASLKLMADVFESYNRELYDLTDGAVDRASQVARLSQWIKSQGVECTSLGADFLEELLTLALPDKVRRALEIRAATGSAAVKKLYALANSAAKNGRIHDAFVYHAARTGRAASVGIQMQNFPSAVPDTYLSDGSFSFEKTSGGEWGEWDEASMEYGIEHLKTLTYQDIESHWGRGKTFDLISACLRGLITCDEGNVLLGSDYSAIEAVMLAAISGESWRLDVFNTHGKIYEMSAAKISGVSFDEIVAHKKDKGTHHPLRKTLGKVAELASGYGGGIGSWKQFGADEHLSDDEIQRAVYAWRAASPMVVALWRGLDSAAKSAILSSGHRFTYRSISYLCQRGILYCTLPSGRNVVYHNAQIEPGKFGEQISFWGWNTNSKNGRVRAWIKMSTYGARLAENVCQAAARDILAHAIVRLEKAGYPVVLHVHDEIACEVPDNSKEFTLEGMEKIMEQMPDWAQGWPVFARNGWHGKRFRK